MKKNKKILFTLMSLSSISSVMLSASCLPTATWIIPPSQTPPSGSVSGGTGSGGNNGGSTSGTSDPQEEKIVQEKGYVAFKTPLINAPSYLKANNIYYFKELNFKPYAKDQWGNLINPEYQIDENTFINQNWYSLKPKMYRWERNDEDAKQMPELQNAGFEIPNERITGYFESAAGLYHLIRTYVSMDINKNGVENGGHINVPDEKNINRQFLNEIKAYINSNKDPLSTNLYDEFKAGIVDNNKNGDKYWDNKFYYSLLKYNWDTNIKEIYNSFYKWGDYLSDQEKMNNGYLENMMNGWTSFATYKDNAVRKDNAPSWFVLPFSFGTNTNITSKFKNYHYNMYNNPNALVNSTYPPTYNNWLPRLLNYMQNMPRVLLNEQLNFNYYRALINWMDALSTINDHQNAYQWSNLSEEAKSDLKIKSQQLMEASLNYLSWKTLLLGEWEATTNKNMTVAELYPTCQNNDWEYTYVFAYKFLYENLVPLFKVENWTTSSYLQFETFDKLVNNNQTHDSYIYDYVFNYLNVIFKNEYKDFKTFNKMSFNDDLSQNQEAWLKVLRNWNSAFGLNFYTDEI